MVKETVVLGVIMVVLIVGLFIAVPAGLKKMERLECEKWQDEAVKYPAYFLASWQKEQCDTYDIQIDAPVKKTPAEEFEELLKK